MSRSRSPIRDVTLEVEGFKGYLKLGAVTTTTENFAGALSEMLEAPEAKMLIAKFPHSSFRIRVRAGRPAQALGVAGDARYTRRVRR